MLEVVANEPGDRSQLKLDRAQPSLVPRVDELLGDVLDALGQHYDVALAPALLLLGIGQGHAGYITTRPWRRQEKPCARWGMITRL
jgi:hypothetical protein